MRLLLDTHVLLWWLTRSDRLSVDARVAIADESSEVTVSAASAWEIAMKARLGRLPPPHDLEQQLERHSFSPLPITVEHALWAGGLELHNGDPFDRILVAQAQIEGMTIVTRDARIAAYGVPTLAA